MKIRNDSGDIEEKTQNGWYNRYRMNQILRKYNSAISLQANIKGVPTLPHGLIGIFISKGAEIGSGCTIFQNVTIGFNTLEGTKRPGSPKIGDNVFIGALVSVDFKSSL